MIGKTVSHYRILEKLGEGGMGVVYKAEDTKLGRTVALKFLPSELTRDPEAKERFIQEAKAASALDHPNICNVHEIGETDDGHMFIAMACYEGETLKKKIERGALPLERAISTAIQVAEGLAKAHARRIVHRDIKPANVIVTDEGVAKILDFGLAKLAGQVRLTKSTSTLGTVAYMSPEQARGDEVDSRTDIWSLGVVLYEMVTGRLPFRGEHEQAMIYSILNEETLAFPVSLPSLRPAIENDLERILRKTLAKRPEERYQDINDMLTDLKSFVKRLEPATAIVEPDKIEATRERRLRQYSGLAIGGGLIVALFMVSRSYLFPPARGPIDSIAVLPLQNLSGDPSQEYFSDGMTEAVISELQKIRSLRVISRTSVMHFKKTQKLLPEIARELNVKAIVEGSVSREGDNVRVNVQLIQASPEKHLWAQSFDRNMTSILELESDVAQAIARQIRVVVTPDEQKRIAGFRTVNAEAYEAYLKGRFYWNKRQGDDLKTAIRYFDQAIERDSGYADAYAGLALTYEVLPEYSGLSMKESMPKAEAAARKALELDPTLAEAHTALAFVKGYEGDKAGEEAEYERAIELNPGYPTAHHWYGMWLRDRGRSDEAQAEIKRALELDPLSLIINTVVGDELYYITRRYPQAVEQYKRVLELDPNFAYAHRALGFAYALQGKLNESIAEFRKVRSLAGGGPYGLEGLGYAYARLGMRSDATKILDELIMFSRRGYSVSYDIALVYLGLGDKDRALEWLERANEEQHILLTSIKSDPVWDGLRSDPRFVALLKKIGLGE